MARCPQESSVDAALALLSDAWWSVIDADGAAKPSRGRLPLPGFVYGSWLLMRPFADVDVCLLSPDSMTHYQACGKLIAEMRARGVSYSYFGRSPRYVVTMRVCPVRSALCMPRLRERAV